MRLTKENFPVEIKRLRKKRGWTVADLAERVRVSPRTVENWEQGRRVPTGLELVNLFCDGEG